MIWQWEQIPEFLSSDYCFMHSIIPLYNRPRVTLQNAMGHISTLSLPFAIRTLLYGDDNLDLTENKRIITETLRFVNDSNRFA